MRTAIARSARATCLLVSGAGTAAPAVLGLLAALLAGVACATVAALPLLPDMVRPLRALAAAERRRAGQVTGWEIPAPYRPAGGSRWQRARTVLRDPATWRDLAWMLADGLCGVPAAAIAVLLWPFIVILLSMPLWWWAAPRGTVSAFVTLTSWPEAIALPLGEAAICACVLWWLVPRLAGWQLRLAEKLLGPAGGAGLAQRVRQLTESRAGALEAHAAELRRIERDLHDGTQAHLVSVAVRLGLAERGFTTQPQEALKLLHEARDGVEDTALDPEVVWQLMNRRDRLDPLTPREREVLQLMAEGHDNTTIASTMVITERAVHKHVGNVFRKLGLPPIDSGHRRVLAVLAYLNS